MCPHTVDIVQLTAPDDHLIEGAVDVYLNAFVDETFTAALIDLSIKKNRQTYYRLIKSRLYLYLEAGHQLIVALVENRVAGMLILKSPRVTLSVWKIISHVFKFLSDYLKIARHGIRVVYLASAARPPAGIPPVHFLLEGLAVDPPWQGRGVAGRLLSAAEKYSRNEGSASGIYLLTGSEKNRKIYEHFNYSVVEARPNRRFTAYHMFRSFVQND